MAFLPTQFSEDQADAYDAVADILRKSGVDLDDALLTPASETKTHVMAVIGRVSAAGFKKVALLAKLPGQE